MNFNKRLFILFFLLIYSCSEEEVNLFSEECVECIEHQYSQAYNDTFIVLTLEPGEYCLADSIWLMPNGVNYWAQLDQTLLDMITESGYCEYLELENEVN